MILKTILAVLVISPLLSHAAISEKSENHKEYTVSDENCHRSLMALAKSLCDISGSELSEVHRDQFRMRTQAEDSLDEWIVFADSLMRLVKVHRYTDFNQEATYDKNEDYCYIDVACYK
jgi:hypothetical protein